MKRCSECEFTFEEHQQFCDFDGTELSVVPEPFPSFKKAPVPATVFPSLFLRVARSRVSLAVLALAGVMLSALLVGYFESVSQPNIDIATKAESQNDMMNPVPQDPSESSDQAKPEEVSKSRFISTQRTIQADEKLVASPKKKSRTSRSEGTKRRFEKTNSDSVARNQKIGPQKAHQEIASQKANSELVARNQKKPDDSKSQSSKRDSKVVAILKKTGRILKRPFEF
jgi:hypothetical protein